MSRVPFVRGLSLHARYVCEHSGACCTAGWEISVEHTVDRELRRAHAAGTLLPTAEVPLLVRRPGLPDEFASVLGRAADGACVLHDPGSHRCRAHARLGPQGKPAACRQFPRLLVRDPRGVSVSLSHFCPTAAALLFADTAPLAIVDVSEDTALDPSESLDLRHALPPALDTSRLVDWDTLTAWEQLLCDVCIHAAGPEQALTTLHDAWHHLRSWTQARGTMVDWLGGFTASSGPGEAAGVTSTNPAIEEALVGTAIPDGLCPPAPPEPSAGTWEALGAPAWPSFARPLCRYLAARGFACWPLHFGRGIETQLRYLGAALALVQCEAARQVSRHRVVLDQTMLRAAIRHADLLLIHLADPRVLAERLDDRR